MIQFNLLPDVKMEYIKARRTKRTVALVSAIVSAAALSLFVLLFLVVNVFQKQHLSGLDHDINEGKKTLQAKPDLSKVLTIQNQLNSLPDLHKQKPVVSRSFGFIQQITPASASISTFELNFADQTMRIEGSADSLATVNTFVDTIKFTSYGVGTSKGDWKPGESYKVDDIVSHANRTYIAVKDNNGSSDSEPESGSQWQSNWKEAPFAFKEVVLSEFAVAAPDQQKDKNKAVTYKIQFKYDPTIFDSQKTASLVVSKKITTRSETEKPAAIFQAKPTTTEEGSNQ